MLRSPEAASPLKNFSSGKFYPVISHFPKEWAEEKRIVFCSGKIYWDLVKWMKKNKFVQNFALVRIEQLYPFPKKDIIKLLETQNFSQIIWLQEEPRNNGAYTYMRENFGDLQKNIFYIGRKSSASPAIGSLKRHTKRQHGILNAVLVFKNQHFEI